MACSGGAERRTRETRPRVPQRRRRRPRWVSYRKFSEEHPDHLPTAQTCRVRVRPRRQGSCRDVVAARSRSRTPLGERRTGGDGCHTATPRGQGQKFMEPGSNVAVDHPRCARRGARRILGYRGALVCAVVVGAALVPGGASARPGVRALGARDTAVSLGDELSGLVADADGPPGRSSYGQARRSAACLPRGVRRMGSTQPVPTSDPDAAGERGKAFSAAVALSARVRPRTVAARHDRETARVAAGGVGQGDVGRSD